MDGFARHIAACNNATLPGQRIPFRIGPAQVGWVSPEAARALTFRPGDFHFDAGGIALAGRHRAAGQRSAALAGAARALAEGGFCRLRGEAFDVAAAWDAAPLATLDRGAVPVFGVIGQGIHLNGVVRRADGPWLWMAVRAADKPVAPGLYDNLVAGGMPAGLDARTTLLKEGEEEAGLPPALLLGAHEAERIAYTLDAPEGLRRDLLHVFDLELPEDVIPRPVDGEVERFELVPAQRVLEIVRDTDSVKFNVNLVLIGWAIREGLLAGAEAAALARGLRGWLDAG
jgi:thiamine pyrophosphokinase